MKKSLSRGDTDPKKRRELIERLLLDGSDTKKVADEVSFHIIEIIPDFETFSKKLNKGTLTYDDIVNLISHVPYHARGMEESWEK